AQRGESHHPVPRHPPSDGGEILPPVQQRDERIGRSSGTRPVGCQVLALVSGRASRPPTPTEGLAPCRTVPIKPRSALTLPQISRNPVAMGRRAARMAGKSPPINPITVAVMIALTRSRGVTAKANAT